MAKDLNSLLIFINKFHTKCQIIPIFISSFAWLMNLFNYWTYYSIFLFLNISTALFQYEIAFIKSFLLLYTEPMLLYDVAVLTCSFPNLVSLIFRHLKWYSNAKSYSPLLSYTKPMLLYDVAVSICSFPNLLSYIFRHLK